MHEMERLLLSLGLNLEHDGYQRLIALLRILTGRDDRAAK